MPSRALVLIVALSAAAPCTTLARDAGTPSGIDPNVRIFTYARDQIYVIDASFGYTTQIWVGADETVQSAQSGDAEAWDISVPDSGDYVAIKPTVRPPRPTNLVVYTNRRVYQFALGADESASLEGKTLTARFRYPASADSLDALGATVATIRELEGDLAAERSRRETAQARLGELTSGLEERDRELAAREATEALQARLADIEAQLAGEQRTRAQLERDRVSLQSQLSAIQADKDRQVYESLETRLSTAEAARQASETRSAALQAELASIREAQLRREEDRIAREVEGLRRDREALRAAEARIASLEAERRAAEAARRTSVVYDAFAPARSRGVPDRTLARPGPDAVPASYTERVYDLRESDRIFLDDAAATGVPTAQAVRIEDLGTKVLQGALLSGTLETAIDTTLSGQVRAVLSEPVYAADGSQVLAQAGSRLVGEYRSFVRFGTDRVLIAWNRLVTPDGVSVALGSPGTDALGRAGLEGFADTRFATRFGAAALISIIGGGSALLVSQATDELASDTAQRLADDNAQATARIFDPYIDIPTTVHVDQGALIRVFVTRDLDFSAVR